MRDELLQLCCGCARVPFAKQQPGLQVFGVGIAGLILAIAFEGRARRLQLSGLDQALGPMHLQHRGVRMSAGCLLQNLRPMCEVAVNDIDLLRRVVEHKTKFYYSAWARYDLAVPGTLALVPRDERIAELRRDYGAMSVMIFGDPPPLEDLLSELANLERLINLPSPE